MFGSKLRSPFRFTPGTICVFAFFAVALLSGATSLAHAQTYTMLHSFTGQGDGSSPWSNLTMDRGGNLYGTTPWGGNLQACPGGCGIVFKLSREGSGWTFSTIYTFQAGSDGDYPSGGVTIGPDGALYGTTNEGGTGCDGAGCGTVYKLTPSPTFCRSVSCPWTKTILHDFNGQDGEHPDYGNVIFDQAGNLYGTTEAGGSAGWGSVYELSPSNGGWVETVLWIFDGTSGGDPRSGVVFDRAGNLYGTARVGGTYQAGVVYELSPSGSGWTETTVLNLDGNYEGSAPIGGLAIDQQGNLYGTTCQGGSLGAGTAFQLTPSNGSWSFHLMEAFGGIDGPFDAPTLDAAGNVFVTSTFTGGGGRLVELTFSAGSWTSNTLHSFSLQGGWDPIGGVTLDADGNIYGTASSGGSDGKGVVFEVAP
jgi:uncharacterized repeat protein (TIGR03803 family)